MDKPNDLLKAAKEINSQFHEIREQAIHDINGSVVGWNSYVFSKSGRPIAGGTAERRDTARRIGLAEFFERSLVKKISREQVRAREFLLDRVPTTSGFAAGFDQDSTKFRSLCEGVERWAWSHWIDKGRKISEIETKPKFSPLATHLSNQFSSSKLLQHEFILAPEVFAEPLVLSIFLGLSGNGVFAGSRVTTRSDDLWTHAVIEAWRNLENFRRFSKLGPDERPELNWLERRVLYFGQNKDEAFRQISGATRADWTSPKIELVLGTEEISGVYLWRTLLENFDPWHLGPDSRFVY